MVVRAEPRVALQTTTPLLTLNARLNARAGPRDLRFAGALVVTLRDFRAGFRICVGRQ